MYNIQNFMRAEKNIIMIINNALGNYLTSGG